MRRVPAAALPDPGGQRPPLPHRPHHRTDPSLSLSLSLSLSRFCKIQLGIARGG